MTGVWKKKYKSRQYKPTNKFKVNDIVISKLTLKSENGDVYPIGTKFRVIAIAPKVFISKVVSEYFDKEEFFLNLVLADVFFPEGKEWMYENRVRCNFICVEKEK